MASSSQITQQAPDFIPDDVMQNVLTYLAGNNYSTYAIDTFINTGIQNIRKGSNLQAVKALCYILYGGAAPLQAARTAFSSLVTACLTLDDDYFKSIAAFMVTVHQIPDSSISFAFESMLYPIRERLVSIYEQKNRWREAAQILVQVPSDSSITATPEQSLRHNIRIAHLYISAGLVDHAESFLNRTTVHLQSCTDDALRLHHRICHARILDLKGRFEDAAHRYYMLANESQSTGLMDVMTDTHVPALVHAVTCAILAKAGPRRSRLLAMLHNDERSRRLDIFPLLQSIHMGRLLCKQQVDRFRPTLQSHQLTSCDGDDGETVLDRAVIEHNVQAVSRMYSNIGLDQLGALLNVTAEKAEKTARVMINEKRMLASIDQVERVVEFSNKCPTHKIEHWDALIASLCGQVDDCVESIVDTFPQFTSLL